MERNTQQLREQGKYTRFTVERLKKMLRRKTALLDSGLTKGRRARVRRDMARILDLLSGKAGK